MKSFAHCAFKHEREAFAKLALTRLDPQTIELYPCTYIADTSRNVYHECDLIVIAESFGAVVELKHWHGDVEVGENIWRRGGTPIRDPHEVNLPKAKVFKSVIERALPAASAPFVQSIVVLTGDARVSGADTALEVLGRLEAANGRVGDHLTFDGIEELAKYLRVRIEKDRAAQRKVLRPYEFTRLRSILDQKFDVQGLKKSDFSDQISGFKIREELENTPRYVSYLAEIFPTRGDTQWRLRVFGTESQDEAERARQYRSLDALQKLPFHPNIRPAHRHPNERNLVVEACQWTDVRTLDQVLRAGQNLSHRLAVQIARDVALALAHIHESNASLIHRNINPRSIILGRDDHVELVDFDLAFDPSAGFTVMGGTPPAQKSKYMAREILAGQADYSSDVYSLGQVLAELLKARQEPDPEDERLRELVRRMSDDLPAKRPSARVVAETLSATIGARLTPEPPSRVASPPQVGDEYDTWVLSEELGRGATSVVFRADSHGDRAVLKVFGQDASRERCLTERDFLRLARSPFVVSFRSFMQWAGSYWCIVQEHAPGKSLRRLIDDGSVPDASLFREVANQILQGLGQLHTSRDLANEPIAKPAIIHNDVTPGNIVLDADRRVAKLVDFGLACAPGLGVIGGTPGYVSEDRVTKEGYIAEPAGDLFSLAITLVEWATGTRPSSPSSVPLLFGGALPPHQAEGVTDVLRRALGPRDSAFATAEEMSAALNGAYDAALLKSLPPSQTTLDIATTVAEVSATAPLAIDPAPLESADCAASDFVEYLNTVHNVSANNRHALAEAQAISPYFVDLHVEMELTNSIEHALANDCGAVVVLTGHAGDGKSTIAVEFLKKARGIAPTQPLTQPPQQEEQAEWMGRPVTVLKDMSELPAATRLAKLREAMEGTGSALIVSNTGPLLSTFQEYFKDRRHHHHEIEQEILRALDQPLPPGALGVENSFGLHDGKTVYIANLSMLGNVSTAVRLFDKLITHSAWSSCAGCPAAPRCPIRLNVSVLHTQRETVKERIGFVYERLAAYGRRMSMRQLAAHLSFSLTAGYSCADIRAGRLPPHESLIFSETFFGHAGARSEQAVDALFCLTQMADLHFGAASSPEVDGLVHQGHIQNVLAWPSQLAAVLEKWQGEAQGEGGGEARRRLRRLAFFFATPIQRGDRLDRALLDDFLQSPMLRRRAGWVASKNVGSGVEKQKFIRRAIGVLMEEFTGCMTPEGNWERLFLTVRRPDEQVFQSIQIVLKAIPLDDFDLTFDRKRLMPCLTHTGSTARLRLSLPLLDYIVKRSRGEVATDLDAIHRAALEQFRGELLESRPTSTDVITVVEISNDGGLQTHRFSFSEEGPRLVYQ